jgi:hypothetical protein
MSDSHIENEKVNTNNAVRFVAQQTSNRVVGIRIPTYIYASQLLVDNANSDSDYSDNSSEVSTYDEHPHEITTTSKENR